MEQQIDELNAEVSSARQTLTELVENVTLNLNESVTLKKLSQNVTNRLQQQRHKNRLAAKEVIDKEVSVERAQQLVETMKQKLKTFSDKNFDAQERLRSLDELMESEEKNMSKITAENMRLGGSLFRLSKMLNELKADHKVQEVKKNVLIISSFILLTFFLLTYNRWKSIISSRIQMQSWPISRNWRKS